MKVLLVNTPYRLSDPPLGLTYIDIVVRGVKGLPSKEISKGFEVLSIDDDLFTLNHKQPYLFVKR